jgi:tetratricopeptide (TPR) repeat protein
MRAAYRALDLDPALGEAHDALAAVFGKTEFDWTRTIGERQRAIALSPVLELPYHYLAGALYHLGLLDEADRALDSAEALNPVGDKGVDCRTPADIENEARRFRERYAAGRSIRTRTRYVRSRSCARVAIRTTSSTRFSRIGRSSRGWLRKRSWTRFSSPVTS